MNEEIYLGPMWWQTDANMEYILNIIQTLTPIFTTLSLFAFLLTAYWLYAINKKLGEKNPWLSFVPIINYYMYFVAGNNSFLKYFVYPLIALFVLSILSFLTFWISLLVGIAIYLYYWIKNLHCISKRTGRWTWTTLWFLFIPIIMFPLVGYTFKPVQQQVSNVGNAETNKKTIDEEIFEL